MMRMRLREFNGMRRNYCVAIVALALSWHIRLDNYYNTCTTLVCMFHSNQQLYLVDTNARIQKENGRNGPRLADQMAFPCSYYQHSRPVPP